MPVGALADSVCSLEVTSKLNSFLGYEYPAEATIDRRYYVCKALPNNPDKIVVAMVINGDHVLIFEDLIPKENENSEFKGHLNVLIIWSAAAQGHHLQQCHHSGWYIDRYRALLSGGRLYRIRCPCRQYRQLTRVYG
jgi:hypothetical protein